MKKLSWEVHLCKGRCPESSFLGWRRVGRSVVADLLLFRIPCDSVECEDDFGSKVSVEVEVWDGPPGPRWCHCMRGPLTPDADSCDLWP